MIDGPQDAGEPRRIHLCIVIEQHNPPKTTRPPQRLVSTEHVENRREEPILRTESGHPVIVAEELIHIAAITRRGHALGLRLHDHTYTGIRQLQALLKSA